VGRDFTCTVNPCIGKSDKGLPIDHPAKTSKHVVIVGAGPGGMEAARVATIRGHKVTLIDKGRHLGGLLNLASVLNEFLEPLLDWYTLQLGALPIDLRLKTEATVSLLKQLNPDEIIIAPGSEVIAPDIPGIDGKQVIKSSDLKLLVMGKAPKKGFLWRCAAIGTSLFGNNKSFMRFAMLLPWPIKKEVVVLGGGFAGCEVALELMKKKRRVTIVEESDKILADQGPVTKGTEIALLKEKEVRTITGANVTKIMKDHVVIRYRETGQEESIPAKSVVSSVGISKNRALFEEVARAFDSVHLIGDAVGLDEASEQLAPNERPQPYWEKARRVREAVRDGYQVAMKV